MSRRLKYFTGISVAIVSVIFIAAAWYLVDTLPIGTGHVAKTMCSNIFIAGRPAAEVFEQDIAPVHPLFALTGYSVDTAHKKVMATALGIVGATAIYREGCGCTIVYGTTEAKLRKQQFMITPPERGKKDKESLPWPEGDAGPAAVPAGVDKIRLNAALDHAFAETEPGNPKKTRAVVVVYKGKLIAERYAPGIDKSTPLLGWSMSKSVVNALVGILVGQGKIDLYGPAPVPEWQHPDDPRHNITLDQLMRMSSGLEFGEAYEPFSDAVEMFYDSYDFAAYAARKPLIAEPDTLFHYSSGTANIISRIVRNIAEKKYVHYYRFLREALFDRIGMHSAVFEPDPSGTIVGSSYVFATPRDWARFGLLYLNDGVWNGERILPEGWVKYTTTPTPTAPQGEYGALFWLNAGTSADPQSRRRPAIPRDAFSAEGFQGQRVMIIPSEKLVLVRLGNCSYEGAWDDEKFVGEVTAALHHSGDAAATGRI